MSGWEFFLIAVGVAMVGLWGCWESRYLIKEGPDEYELRVLRDTVRAL